MQARFTKYQIATAIAILFHAVGLIGLLFLDKTLFLQLTPGNLLLMLILLIWTQTEKNKWFLLFLITSIVGGLIIEIIGVQTGTLFGHYSYGTVMGYKIVDTPLILGVNWFTIVYCCGMSFYLLTGKVTGRASLGTIGDKEPGYLSTLVVAGGAFLAVFYDWLMEPVAVTLNYWQWEGDGVIPVYNYVCWFLASGLLLWLFRVSKFEKRNKFAVNLLLIQLLFFLLLRIFLD